MPGLGQGFKGYNRWILLIILINFLCLRVRNEIDIIIFDPTGIDYSRNATITAAPGCARGIKVKARIAEVLDIRLNEVERLKKNRGCLQFFQLEDYFIHRFPIISPIFSAS